MQPGGAHPRANTTTNGNGGGGFRDGRAQLSRPPAAAQEVTPQEKEEVLMAAGRLAAEYLVSRGDLPPDVLDNRPPPPLPSSLRGRQQPPRGFHFQGRPPAPQRRGQFQWELRPYEPQRRHPGPRPFRRGGGGGPGPFPKQPRHAGARPYPYGCARGPAASKPPGYFAGHAAAAPKTAGRVEEGNGDSAAAGDASDSQPTAQPASGVTPSAQQTNQPSTSSLGADDSE